MIVVAWFRFVWVAFLVFKVWISIQCIFLWKFYIFFFILNALSRWVWIIFNIWVYLHLTFMFLRSISLVAGDLFSWHNKRLLFWLFQIFEFIVWSLIQPRWINFRIETFIIWRLIILNCLSGLNRESVFHCISKFSPLLYQRVYKLSVIFKSIFVLFFVLKVILL